MERVISACEGMIPLKQREGRVFRCSRRLRSTDPHRVLGDNTAWQYSQGYGATSPAGTPDGWQLEHWRCAGNSERISLPGWLPPTARRQWWHTWRELGEPPRCPDNNRHVLTVLWATGSNFQQPSSLDTWLVFASLNDTSSKTRRSTFSHAGKAHIEITSYLHRKSPSSYYQTS